MIDLQTLLADASRLDAISGNKTCLEVYLPKEPGEKYQSDHVEFAFACVKADINSLASVMLDLLRPLLPGRPVPIDWYAADAPNDPVAVVFSVSAHGWAVSQYANNARYLTACFRTRAEADREAYYRRFEALLRQAGELAQGGGK